MSGKDPEATNPGLTQDEGGVISIGHAASKFSQEKAAREADENARRVVGEINDAAASSRAPGSEAGDDSPDSKKGTNA